ncbi:hypothetical protein [Nonomuraea jiangxiensis]|uniref:Uncharacterized protein n=1 Tax=Nonomuraea jiangxiensis TaxID=633440 RepID=A0A1G8XSA9_9ACTN|nr:hypothetical protein [Nonomuraea jiangxiensis]SDJ93383.1 hypothetical protein SAMN05421869_11359 [Nonomuraea jiangxiensis]
MNITLPVEVLVRATDEAARAYLTLSALLAEAGHIGRPTVPATADVVDLTAYRIGRGGAA